MVRRTTRRGRQHGAAILLALLIMTLVATLAAGMVWLQWRGIEVETAERARTQADWLLNASLDWGNLILRTQARSNGPNQEDDLGQPWATPLAETKLSSFLSADGNHSDDGGPEAYLSGQITDAESKYNLYNILIESSVPSKPGVPLEEINRLRILCNAIGVPPDTANAIGAALRESQSAQQSAADGVQGNATGPLMPIQVDDLVWLGIDPAIVRQLKPFVQILPPPLVNGTVSPIMTTINANTAPAEVLMAALPGITLAQAQQIVLARQVKPFKDTTEVPKAFGSEAPWKPPTPGPGNQLAIASSHFEIYGQLRYEQNLIRVRSVVWRQNQFSPIQVLRRERIPPDAT
jgi:general secretion pathway protein K